MFPVLPSPDDKHVRPPCYLNANDLPAREKSLPEIRKTSPRVALRAIEPYSRALRAARATNYSMRATVDEGAKKKRHQPRRIPASMY